jgi:hypothetical protein
MFDLGNCGLTGKKLGKFLRLLKMASNKATGEPTTGGVPSGVR